MATPPILEPAFLAQLDRLALVSRRMRAGRIQAERRSPKRGGSVEFADFRTYAPGDDFRRIDWNAYARLERLFLKLFVAEEDLTIHIVLDASQSMLFGEPQKWHFARRLAAALGYIGLVGMDRLVGVALGGVDVGNRVSRAHRGKRQALAWFTWLAGIEPGGELDPEAALRNYVTQARAPGPLLLIGDLLGAGWEHGLRLLAGHRYEVTVLHVLAPQEVSPTLEGDLRLVDSENRAAVEITADYDLLRRYQARLAMWQEHLRSVCAAVDARYVFIETTLPLEELIMAYLRKYDVVA
ncbi:MAG: DUF58 domain-containing protein [Anaerolineae bacterium]|nr:DUF58 domain-containing protein [Anaerolineae bacterium]